MYDADAIEAINFEQLATVTDRLLLRHGRSRLPRARAADDRFTVPSLVAHHPRPVRFARGSQPRFPGDAGERTLVVRPRPSRVRWVAVTVIIPALLGTIAGLLMLL
jgi:hypothetical protein